MSMIESYDSEIEQKLEELRQDWIKYNSTLTFAQYVALRSVR